MKNERNVPKVRFMGFCDDWEQRKVKDIAENTYGGGTPQTSVDSFWNGDIPWIQSQDIIENQLFDVVPRKHISEEAVTKSATKLVPEKSIAIVTRVGVGKLAFMPFSYCTSQDFLSLSGIRIDEKFAIYSIYKMLQKEKQNVQGTSIKGITIEEMLSKKIEVPCNNAEQQQIGSYFRNLDNLITLHQRKCNTLQRLKKAMLQKMFPKNGSLYPEIRFAGFTDAWEQREFGNIAQRLSETAVSGDELPYIEYEDVISNQGILNKDVSAKEGEKTGIVFSEDNVLYGKLRPYLHNWLNPDFKGVAVGDWWVLKPINADKNFLYRLIQSDNFDSVTNQSTGTKMPRADWKLVSATEFCLPKSFEEQAKIGQYFTDLDHLITLHQRKLETLKKLKKSMLQKMFI